MFGLASHYSMHLCDPLEVNCCHLNPKLGRCQLLPTNVQQFKFNQADIDKQRFLGKSLYELNVRNGESLSKFLAQSISESL